MRQLVKQLKHPQLYRIIEIILKFRKVFIKFGIKKQRQFVFKTSLKEQIVE